MMGFREAIIHYDYAMKDSVSQTVTQGIFLCTSINGKANITLKFDFMSYSTNIS